MGITASLTRRYIRHEENPEDRELRHVTKLKQKIIQNPPMEMILLLSVCFNRALQDQKNETILSLTDPKFIREIIFKSKPDHVELFSDFFSQITNRTEFRDDKLSELIEYSLSLHQTPLPDDGYERLKYLKLSDTTIYILNHYTRSNLRIPEEKLNIVRIILTLSNQESMDNIQAGRFRALIATHNEHIRNNIEEILIYLTSPIQLTRILERLDFVDQTLIRKITHYFNKWIEGYYSDCWSFTDDPIVEQWIECFRQFLEGDNKQGLKNELLSCSSNHRTLADYVIYRLEHQT